MLPIIRFAWRGLTRRRLQVGLIGLALTIALSGSLGLIAVLTGMRTQLRRDLQRVGTDVVNVHISPTLSNVLASPLKLDHCVRMQEISQGRVAPFLIQLGVAESEAPPSEAETEGTTAQVSVIATTSTWSSIVPLEYLEGRFFRGNERGVCVLDEWVAQQIFPEQSALDKTLTLRRFGEAETYRVVGVLNDPFDIRNRFDELDITSSARSRMLRIMEFKSLYLPAAFESPEDSIHGAVVECPPGSDPLEMPFHLRAELDLGESIWAWSRQQWVEGILMGTDIATAIANVIWIIVLMVTGIMIATISLVAIRQRFREIAIRRTEGARRSQIIQQLLLENFILGSFSGGFALFICRAANWMQPRYISWSPDYRVIDSVLVLSVGLGLSALATYFPARRAASLDPVEVMSRS